MQKKKSVSSLLPVPTCDKIDYESNAGNLISKLISSECLVLFPHAMFI